jgi:hypothetical protein
LKKAPSFAWGFCVFIPFLLSNLCRKGRLYCSFISLIF